MREVEKGPAVEREESYATTKYVLRLHIAAVRVTYLPKGGHAETVGPQEGLDACEARERGVGHRNSRGDGLVPT